MSEWHWSWNEAVFQFTPPRGGRHYLQITGSQIHSFQFTPPRGGRPGRATRAYLEPYFNSRPRVGGDAVAVAARLVPVISIHAPAWGATCRFKIGMFSRQFQFTPPRGGRLEQRTMLSELLYISIHAPAWGATAPGVGEARPVDISIHAPAWGATQPRGLDPAGGLISIHAPAWGATASLSSFLRFA